jgi:hypothetical protein
MAVRDGQGGIMTEKKPLPSDGSGVMTTGKSEVA